MFTGGQKHKSKIAIACTKELRTNKTNHEMKVQQRNSRSG
jgi:hypothetical protein